MRVEMAPDRLVHIESTPFLRFRPTNGDVEEAGREWRRQQVTIENKESVPLPIYVTLEGKDKGLFAVELSPDDAGRGAQLPAALLLQPNAPQTLHVTMWKPQKSARSVGFTAVAALVGTAYPSEGSVSSFYADEERQTDGRTVVQVPLLADTRAAGDKMAFDVSVPASTFVGFTLPGEDFSHGHGIESILDIDVEATENTTAEGKNKGETANVVFWGDSDVFKVSFPSVSPMDVDASDGVGHADGLHLGVGKTPVRVFFGGPTKGTHKGCLAVIGRASSAAIGCFSGTVLDHVHLHPVIDVPQVTVLPDDPNGKTPTKTVELKAERSHTHEQDSNARFRVTKYQWRVHQHPNLAADQTQPPVKVWASGERDGSNVNVTLGLGSHIAMLTIWDNEGKAITDSALMHVVTTRQIPGPKISLYEPVDNGTTLKSLLNANQGDLPKPVFVSSPASVKSLPPPLASAMAVTPPTPTLVKYFEVPIQNAPNGRPFIGGEGSTYDKGVMVRATARVPWRYLQAARRASSHRPMQRLMNQQQGALDEEDDHVILNAWGGEGVVGSVRVGGHVLLHNERGEHKIRGNAYKADEVVDLEVRFAVEQPTTALRLLVNGDPFPLFRSEWLAKHGTSSNHDLKHLAAPAAAPSLPHLNPNVLVFHDTSTAKPFINKIDPQALPHPPSRQPEGGGAPTAMIQVYGNALLKTEAPGRGVVVKWGDDVITPEGVAHDRLTIEVPLKGVGGGAMTMQQGERGDVRVGVAVKIGDDESNTATFTFSDKLAKGNDGPGPSKPLPKIAWYPPFDFPIEGGPTAATMGPDGNLYVGTVSGLIHVVQLAHQYNGPDAAPLTVRSHSTIRALKDVYGDEHSILGIRIDPYSDPNAPHLYVAHADIYAKGHGCDRVLKEGLGFIGRISRITLRPEGDEQPPAVQPVLSNLPCSNGDVCVNGMDFDFNGTMYWGQGSVTNGGPAECFFGMIEESPLSGAIGKAEIRRPDFNGYVMYDYKDTVYTRHKGLAGKPAPNDQRNASLFDISPKTRGVDWHAAGFHNSWEPVVTTKGDIWCSANGASEGLGKRFDNAGVDVFRSRVAAAQATAKKTGRDPATIECGLGWPECQPRQVPSYSSDRIYGPLTGRTYHGYPNPNRAQSDPRQWYFYAASDPPNPARYQQGYHIDSSTNGITEFRGACFGGQLRGDLVAAQWNQKVFRVHRTASDAGDGFAPSVAVSVLSNQLKALGLEYGPGCQLLGLDFSGNRLTVLTPKEEHHHHDHDAEADDGHEPVVWDVTPWRGNVDHDQRVVIGGRRFLSNNGLARPNGITIGPLACIITDIQDIFMSCAVSMDQPPPSPAPPHKTYPAGTATHRTSKGIEVPLDAWTDMTVTFDDGTNVTLERAFLFHKPSPVAEPFEGEIDHADCVLDDVDLPDYDVKWLDFVPSVYLCQQECVHQTDPPCDAFSYVHTEPLSAMNCWLKHITSATPTGTSADLSTESTLRRMADTSSQLRVTPSQFVRKAGVTMGPRVCGESRQWKWLRSEALKRLQEMPVMQLEGREEGMMHPAGSKPDDGEEKILPDTNTNAAMGYRGIAEQGSQHHGFDNSPLSGLPFGHAQRADEWPNGEDAAKLAVGASDNTTKSGSPSPSSSSKSSSKCSARNVYFTGDIARALADVPSADACQAACRQMRECLFWTFIVGMRERVGKQADNCVLKHTAGSVKPNAEGALETISGPKECSADTDTPTRRRNNNNNNNKGKGRGKGKGGWKGKGRQGKWMGKGKGKWVGKGKGKTPGG
ncbi:unnamed protein product [Vitrella brassicaformis CCMP3155]|uniref:Apple domain-containing protein n=1 Tax=Vitrella brassicaformis (strain CCMP3155) TaxID=1169540 RepID=A0A0G4GDZ1_VITBC|nr:unnamed protein product [Vitrella brassicaformis CCMP3155]|eukprot:CEM27649.1 unnamed protein product [Vitrella brassicaformis CCMP3155]